MKKVNWTIHFLMINKIVELTNAAKPDQKSPISFNKHVINQETFTKAKERLDDLLKTSVVSQT
ncbi:hypothetical protein AAUPMB_20722, partial [Pasteurella multocida subsp. multocida str. Anand1_buffalo]